MAVKDKDLRGVKGELREVQDENSRLAEKLSDIQAQKKKFSRLAREKAEEMGEGGKEEEGGGGRGREGEGERERERESERERMLVYKFILVEEMLAKVDSLRKSNKEVDRERRMVNHH